MIPLLIVISIPENLNLGCTVCGAASVEAYSNDDESVVAIIGAACRLHALMEERQKRTPRLPCARPSCADPECRFDHGEEQ